MEFNKCPRCGGTLIPAKALAGNDSKFWYQCSNTFCGTIVDKFKPYGMQYNFLKDPAKYKGTFGGFGSGKSIAVIKNVIKHCLITPNAYVGIVGFTYKQIKRNFKKDFDEEMPVILMKHESGQKTPGFNQGEMIYKLKNGAKIELITADDLGKIRGLNATLVVILEASNVMFKIFDSLKSRLRNDNAMHIKKDEKGRDIYVLDEKTGEMVPDYDLDWMHILLESNPEANWIYREYLLNGSRIQFYGNSYHKYPYRLDTINPQYSLHISATDANPYLPKNYLEVNTAGKPPWEVKRFYYGSFLFSENMVYPRINEVIVDPYPINFNDPDNFFVIGYDYGLSDKSAFVFGVLNFKKHSLVFYDEIGVVDMSVKQIAEPYREKLSVIPDGKLLFLPKMDAKSYSKRGADKKSIGSLFEDIGLLFDPIQEDPEVRTMKINSLIDNGQLQIFRTCSGLVEEISDYKYIVNSKGEVTNKRVDKRNHFIDAMEFATIKIPFDLEKATIDKYIRPGERIVADLHKNRPKPIELTEEQKVIQRYNPLDFSNQPLYKEDDYLEEEIDTIINKLSGI